MKSLSIVRGEQTVQIVKTSLRSARANFYSRNQIKKPNHTKGMPIKRVNRLIGQFLLHRGAHPISKLDSKETRLKESMDRKSLRSKIFQAKNTKKHWLTRQLSELKALSYGIKAAP